MYLATPCKGDECKVYAKRVEILIKCNKTARAQKTGGSGGAKTKNRNVKLAIAKKLSFYAYIRYIQMQIFDS